MIAMHVVTAPMVVVSVPLGTRTSQVRFLEEGTQLPEGVEQASIDHLLSLGMIAEVVADPEPDPEPPASSGPATGVDTPDEQTQEQGPENLDGLDLAGLRAYAAERDIDLAGATRKVDIVAVIRAAQ